MASRFRLSILCTSTFNCHPLLLNLQKVPVTGKIRWLGKVLSLLKAEVMDEPTKGLGYMSCSIIDLL